MGTPEVRAGEMVKLMPEGQARANGTKSQVCSGRGDSTGEDPEQVRKRRVCEGQWPVLSLDNTAPE